MIWHCLPPHGRFQSSATCSGLGLGSLLLLVVTLGAGCAPEPDQASGESWLLPGYEPLFDGTTLTGWRGIGRDDVPAGHWMVEDGAIRKVASGQVPRAADGQVLAGGDLITQETFQDFELRFEWKVAPGANSGIKYNVDEAASVAAAPSTGALGFEYQILDDSLHVDRQIPSHRAGSLYDLIAAPDSKPINPPGEWNTGRIVFEHGHGEHWLNGELVVTYDVSSEPFREAFLSSKYAAIEGFTTHKRGHIVLQDHGDDVWFRHIQILR